MIDNNKITSLRPLAKLKTRNLKELEAGIK